jgi:hypothetical protein
MTVEREHITEGRRCWCKPITLAYGDRLVYDEDGTLIRVEQDRGQAERQVQASDQGE